MASENTSPENPPAPPRFTPGAQLLVDTVQKKPSANIDDWVLILLERNGSMAESLVEGLNSATLIENLREKVKQGQAGQAVNADTLIEQAVVLAKLHGKDRVGERDLASVILTAFGYEVAPDASGAPVSARRPRRRRTPRPFPVKKPGRPAPSARPPRSTAWAWT